MNRKAWVGFLTVIVLLVILVGQPVASAQTPEPPGMISTLGLFTPPPTVYPPTQADQGAQVYFYICLVCHGDQGQGLAAWRQKLKPPDNNCFTSKCHAPNTMQGGFTFPHEVPPVVEAGFLEKFGNAQHLHDYLKSAMPWYAPGDLKDEEYWQLTAYLMRLNGRDPGKQVLSSASAARFDFSRPTAPAGPQPWVYGLVGLLVILTLGGGYFLIYRRRAKE